MNTSDTAVYLIPDSKDTKKWKKAFDSTSIEINPNSTQPLTIHHFKGRYSLNYNVSLQPQQSTTLLPPSVIVVQGPPPPPVKRPKKK
jgi:hypothetical protein